MTVSHHPRLSLSAITAPHRSFEEDMAFSSRAGLGCVGLFEAKLRAFGFERAADEIRRRGFAVSSIIAPPFTLLDPACWATERQLLMNCLDLAAEVGGAVYGPPGRGEFDAWDDNAARYADAVGPCLEHARQVGATLAFEPSLRPQISFVHTLRDALDLARISGTSVVVDIGNAYSERDIGQWIARARDLIAIVQVSDVTIGRLGDPGVGVRALPGSGELPLLRFLSAAVEAGYGGPFEIEFLGGPDVDEPAVLASLALMDRLIAEAEAR